MSTIQHSSESLQQVFASSDRGIPALVDDLLSVGGEQQLCLEWRGDRCRVSSPDGVYEDIAHLPTRRSIFRALLARIAVLCGEQYPGSVTPNGGRCQLAAENTPAQGIWASFVNTPDEQRLELGPLGAGTRS